MRKKFLINPSLQLRHLGWTLAIASLCFASGYFFFETMVGNAVASTPLTMQDWQLLKVVLRWGYLISFIILMGAVGIETYFFTHTIVGPLYALQKGFKKLGEGDFQDKVRIRDTDQFGELITEFEDVKGRLLKKWEDQQSVVDRLGKDLDQLLKTASSESAESIRNKLKEIQSHMENKAS